MKNSQTISTHCNQFIGFMTCRLVSAVTFLSLACSCSMPPRKSPAVRHESYMRGDLLEFVDLYLIQDPERRKVTFRLRERDPAVLPPTPTEFVFTYEGKRGQSYGKEKFGLQWDMTYSIEDPKESLSWICGDEGLAISGRGWHEVLIYSPELSGDYRGYAHAVFKLKEQLQNSQAIPKLLPPGGKAMAYDPVTQHLAVISDSESLKILTSLINAADMGSLVYQQEFLPSL